VSQILAIVAAYLFVGASFVLTFFRVVGPPPEWNADKYDCWLLGVIALLLVPLWPGVLIVLGIASLVILFGTLTAKLCGWKEPKA